MTPSNFDPHNKYLTVVLIFVCAFAVGFMFTLHVNRPIRSEPNVPAYKVEPTTTITASPR